MSAPGTLRGDRAIYGSGRARIGYVRSSTAGVIAFDHTGKAIGTYPTVMAAANALSALTTATREVSR